MSWRDSLRPASFRGVEFKVENHDANFGRRKVTHEYPQRDEPFTEDLGRKYREFSIEGYIVGADYNTQRDKLIAACEQSGKAELVHPYLGSMDVECTGLKVRESSSEGRMCRLSMTFVEAGKSQYPSNSADAVNSVTAAVNKVKSSTLSGFLDKFKIDGFPSFVIDAATARLSSLSSTIANLPINAVADVQSVADFVARVGSLKSDALSLISSPSSLVDSVLGVISSVVDVFGTRSESVFTSMRDQFDVAYTGSEATASRKQQKANHEAFGALVREATIAEQARAAVIRAEDVKSLPDGTASDGSATGGYATRDEALTARDAILDAIDDAVEDATTTTDAYIALTGLRAEVVKGVPSQSLQLPRVMALTPRATLPSLVIAYQVYQDASRADEIATRNDIRHPGFITGGEPIEVIADG